MNDFEVKFITKNESAPKVLEYLNQNFQADPEYPEAIITSIYFDTYDMKYLFEKVNSDNIKSKFRIRWYSDIQTKEASDVSFLEFKHKVNLKRFKRRELQPNKYSDKKLNDSIFSDVFSDFRSFNGEILPHLFPSLVVSYTRSRYFIPELNLRICLDRNIQLKNYNEILLKKTKKSKFLNECVFEMKGLQTELPPQLRALNFFDFRKDAFSKYEQCFEQLLF